MKTESTRFTCPDCGGAIERRQDDGGLTEYRCRVGHLYSPKSALAVHADREENTLMVGGSPAGGGRRVGRRNR